MYLTGGFSSGGGLHGVQVGSVRPPGRGAALPLAQGRREQGRPQRRQEGAPAPLRGVEEEGAQEGLNARAHIMQKVARKHFIA